MQNIRLWPIHQILWRMTKLGAGIYTLDKAVQCQHVHLISDKAQLTHCKADGIQAMVTNTNP